MRRSNDSVLSVLLLLIRLASVAVAALTAARPARADVLVKGELREAAEAPVAGARVRVTDRDAHRTEGVSDANGAFQIPFATHAGSVQCHIERDGYSGAFYVLVVRDGVANAATVHLRSVVGLDRPVISGIPGGGLLIEVLLHNDSSTARSLREVRITGDIGVDHPNANQTPFITFRVERTIEVTASSPGMVGGVGSATDQDGLSREVPVTVRYRASSGGTFELAVAKAIPMDAGSTTGLRFILPAALEASVPVPGQASTLAKVDLAACVPGKTGEDMLRVQAVIDGGAIINAPPAPTRVRLSWE